MKLPMAFDGRFLILRKTWFYAIVFPNRPPALARGGGDRSEANRASAVQLEARAEAGGNFFYLDSS